MGGVGTGLGALVAATMLQSSGAGILATGWHLLADYSDPWIISGLAALLFGSVGLVVPAALDRLRGRVALPFIGALFAATGAALGAGAGLAYTALKSGGPEVVMLLGIVGAGVLGLGWLPWVVQTVTKQRTRLAVALGALVGGLAGAVTVLLGVLS